MTLFFCIKNKKEREKNGEVLKKWHYFFNISLTFLSLNDKIKNRKIKLKK